MIHITRSLFFIAAISAAAACTDTREKTSLENTSLEKTSLENTPLENTSLIEFQSHLHGLCGMVVKGQVTSTDPQDEDWRKEVLTLGPISCPNAVTTVLPLAVGPDKSRVWTLTLQDKGQSLDFRHAHSLKDGSPDPVTGYGGVATADNSTATRAIFPVDEVSKAIFAENDLKPSMTNTWSISITPTRKMEYKLFREGRNFVAEFDLSSFDLILSE